MSRAKSAKSAKAGGEWGNVHGREDDGKRGKTSKGRTNEERGVGGGRGGRAGGGRDGGDRAEFPRGNARGQGLRPGLRRERADEAAYGGREYDPFADYDGDGRSNYAEYLAGTNPFDKSDFLAVRSIEVSGGRAALSFEYVGGHVYGVRAARDLTHPEWLTQKVRASAEGAELEQVAPSADPDAAGEATIWMTPAGDAATGFYVLEAK